MHDVMDKAVPANDSGIKPYRQAISVSMVCGSASQPLLHEGMFRIIFHI
jgi:hypothetical protein